MTTGAIVGIAIGCFLGALIIGLIVGFYGAKKVFEKQLKKNPPISKQTIRMIYSQVGRKPTEQQVNDIFRKVSKTK